MTMRPWERSHCTLFICATFTKVQPLGAVALHTYTHQSIFLLYNCIQQCIPIPYTQSVPKLLLHKIFLSEHHYNSIYQYFSSWFVVLISHWEAASLNCIHIFPHIIPQ